MDTEPISFYTPVLEWLATHGIRLALILVGAYVFQRFGRFYIVRVVRRLVVRGHGTAAAEVQREKTLGAVLDRTLIVIVWILAGLMILSELGVAIAPLLAAAGIAGIAVGFGGQYLIRDIISGLFILMENQYRIGDVVCVDTTCGSVEDITLRMTTLRDLDGTVHHIPHGEIHKVSNLSKQFARVNLDIGVSYDTNLESAIEVVNKVGRELAEDEEWKAHILSAPSFLRVNAFGDSAIILKILGETKPLQQWAVTGELRKRLKIAFDRAGITIPFPQRTVHMAPAGPLRKKKGGE